MSFYYCFLIHASCAVSIIVEAAYFFQSVNVLDSIFSFYILEESPSHYSQWRWVVNIKCEACSNVVENGQKYLLCPNCCYPLNPTGPVVAIGSSFTRKCKFSLEKIPLTHFLPSEVTRYPDYVIEWREGFPPARTHPYICLDCLQVSDILDTPCDICGRRLWRMRRKK